ncbi:stress-responsive transcription factor hsf1 [Entomophthora muscae]|uniref:Stress-responsive transcription factor hsf1 n=1 Tax=Entomophthora muscae TaxID=34485 RepID=A0ACC2RG39_9FUNG|nr:stress-responsive transcription factor hsf1 [Entomophthora muscae]
MSKISPFINSLFRLLSDPSYRNAISWDPNGAGFIIHNIGFFETNLMKQNFKNTTIASFFRQLNLYGFKRTSDGRKFRGRGRDNWCRFYHEHFSPGNTEDLPLIKRIYSGKKPTASPTPPVKRELSESHQIFELYSCDSRVNANPSPMAYFPPMYPIWLPFPDLNPYFPSNEFQFTPPFPFITFNQNNMHE